MQQKNASSDGDEVYLVTEQLAYVNMLTWSLAFLSASNSFCIRSALSSAASTCSCNDLILRFTASRDVTPAILCSRTMGFEKQLMWLRAEAALVSENLTSGAVTSWTLREDRSAVCARAFWRRALEMPDFSPGNASFNIQCNYPGNICWCLTYAYI